MMMILPSINASFNKRFRSNKVDLAPTTSATTQLPVLGKPEKSMVHLGLQRQSFFSSKVGESVPVLVLPTGSPYLHATSNGNGQVSFQDVYSCKAGATIERTGYTYQVYSNDDMTTTPIAQVVPDGKVLLVVVPGQDEPFFTIHTIFQNPSKRYQTRYVIKQNGKRVASSRYWIRGDSYTLSVYPGADPCLMTCLAAIANEIYSA